MKKWLILLSKIIGSLLLLLLIILFFSIEKIDKTPYFETNYYKNSIENIDEAIQQKKTSKGALLAGFARINISPVIVNGEEHSDNGQFNEIKLAGFGDGHLATGVHDSLFAKAIALEVDQQQIVLVSADLVLIPESVTLVIEQILKDSDIDLSRKQLFFGATHTHSSIGNCIPKFVGEAFGGEFQPKVVDWLGKKIAQVIIAAVADKKQAQFASGDIHVPNFIKNRIIGETGRLNDKLTVVSVKQDSARTAVIGIYGAHATTISTWNNQFSGDYPGYFQRSLENKGVDMAMFFAGSVGSHSNKGEGDKFDKAQNIGHALADSAIIVLNQMKYTKETSFSPIAMEIEIPKLQIIHIANTLRLVPWLGQKLMPELNAVYLQGFQLNDLIWTAMPYELSGEFAIDIKNALEIKGYRSAFTSFNGQYLGYIVPSKYYFYDTYEARLMGWYGPSMGDYLMELNYKLANALTDCRL